ncbi:hypothetical protein EV182_001915, partial [Spiromyces aspiralis]
MPVTRRMSSRRATKDPEPRPTDSSATQPIPGDVETTCNIDKPATKKAPAKAKSAATATEGKSTSSSSSSKPRTSVRRKPRKERSQAQTEEDGDHEHIEREEGERLPLPTTKRASKGKRKGASRKSARVHSEADYLCELANEALRSRGKYIVTRLGKSLGPTAVSYEHYNSLARDVFGPAAGKAQPLQCLQPVVTSRKNWLQLRGITLSVDQLTLLSQQEARPYLPSEYNSKAEFRDLEDGDQLGAGQTVPLDPFSSMDIDERHGILFNLGISIWALDWFPYSDGDLNYIVVGGIAKEKGNARVIGQRESVTLSNMNNLKNTLQVLSLDANTQTVRQEIVFAHEFGTVWAAKWCPLSFEDDHEYAAMLGASASRCDGDNKKPLGILAAVFGDGKVRVIAVPRPSVIRKRLGLSGHEPCYIKLDDALATISMPQEVFFQLDWAGCDFLVTASGSTGNEQQVHDWFALSTPSTGHNATSEEEELAMIPEAREDTSHGRAMPKPVLLFPQNIGSIRQICVQPVPDKSVAADITFGQVAYEYPAIKPLTQYCLLSGGSDGRCRVTFLADPYNMLTNVDLSPEYRSGLAWTRDGQNVMFADSELLVHLTPTRLLPLEAYMRRRDGDTGATPSSAPRGLTENFSYIAISHKGYIW